METLFTEQRVKRMTLEAIVIRADGRRENLGVIAAYHRNPLMRLWYRIRGIRGHFNVYNFWR